jgi:hypothetical protein
MILGIDLHTSTTRAQPNPPTVNYLRLILGNEIEYDDLAPDIFDSYENAIRSPEVEVARPIGETHESETES